MCIGCLHLWVHAVGENSIPVQFTTELGTTGDVSLPGVSRGGSSVGVVTETLAVMLEGNILVLLARSLAFVTVVTVILRSILEVTSRVIFETSNVILSENVDDFRTEIHRFIADALSDCCSFAGSCLGGCLGGGCCFSGLFLSSIGCFGGFSLSESGCGLRLFLCELRCSSGLCLRGLDFFGACFLDSCFFRSEGLSSTATPSSGAFDLDLRDEMWVSSLVTRPEVFTWARLVSAGTPARVDFIAFIPVFGPEKMASMTDSTEWGSSMLGGTIISS